MNYRRLILPLLLSPVLFASGAVISVSPGEVEVKLASLDPSDNSLTLTGTIDYRDLAAIARFERHLEQVDLSGVTVASYRASTPDLHGQSLYAAAEIPQYTFFKANIGEIILPATVTAIGNGAFANSAITSVTFPRSLRTIGDHAFYGCRSLTKVTLPSSLTAMGAYAFANSQAMTTADFSASALSVMPPNALAGCSMLSSVSLPSGLRTISTHAFEGTAIRSLDVAQVTLFEDYALAGMPELSEVTLPSDAVIGDGLLMDDINMTVIHGTPSALPRLFAANCGAFDAGYSTSHAAQIGAYALTNTAPVTVVLGAGLTSIGDGAFANSQSLNYIDARELGSTPPDVSEDAFDGIDTAQVTLHVAQFSEDAWEQHPVWSLFNIHSGPSTGTEDIAMGASACHITYADNTLTVTASSEIRTLEVYDTAGTLILSARPDALSFAARTGKPGEILIIRVATDTTTEAVRLMTGR